MGCQAHFWEYCPSAGELAKATSTTRELLPYYGIVSSYYNDFILPSSGQGVYLTTAVQFAE